MLNALIQSLTRDQLIVALADPSVTDDTLRAAVLHCANGAATVAPVAPPPLAPNASDAAKRKAKKDAAKAAPVAPAAQSPADAVVSALAASGNGFAVADVIAAAGGESVVTRSQASSAIKRAVKAGTLFGAGSRRFTRYAATAAIATAASIASRG